MFIPHSISRKLWIPLLVLILGVPLLSWALHATFDGVLESRFRLLTLIGQATGIIGMQLFAFALLLSARLKGMEYFFGGLDKLYVIHHRIGVIAFSFLAVHPLVLAFRYLEDGIDEVMWFLLPINNTLARDLGIYSLLGMLMLLFLTFYGSFFSYRSLKNAHRFMGAAFFLGGLHAFLVPSSMSSDIVLRVSCLGMAFIGCLAFIYRTLLGRFLVSRFTYSVRAVNQVGQGVTELTLSPLGKSMTHLPGQFAMLSFTDSKVVSNEEHPFTVSSCLNNGDVRFSVKGLGDYTSLLGGVSLGTKAFLEGPFGEFYYGYGKQSQVWVAGGVGVTPFVSMAEDLLTKDSISYTIDFFYSIRTEKDAVYDELFTSLAKKHPSFVYHLIPSDTSGFVTGDLIVKTVTDTLTRDIFVCGPPPMMAALTSSLVVLGVKKASIHSEKFSLLK